TATASASFTTITLGGNSQLTATGGGSYSWSPSTGLSCITCQNPMTSPQQTTNYCVTVTDTNGCTSTACLTILVEIPCGEEILKTLLPNAFSPNNDGTNDQLCIPANLCIDAFNLKIYDRWGEKVFESESISKCWDGMFHEKPLNSGVFVYYFVAKLISGEPFSQKGNISLVR
ncbi:MAG TPA: gliding motility-associated C-terminal domain-containing protein, partial [Chitinophagaceae bacterium]|nr:gliding motility-associated C-terminal domain-containing protein [Chitinophagaceae bacterium]